MVSKLLKMTRSLHFFENEYLKNIVIFAPKKIAPLDLIINIIGNLSID